VDTNHGNKGHRRYYQIGGITIQVEADLPINEDTFNSKFKRFEVGGPGKDTISIRHYFSLPPVMSMQLGKPVYRQTPWVVYRRENAWSYVGTSESRAYPWIPFRDRLWGRRPSSSHGASPGPHGWGESAQGALSAKDIYQIAVFSPDHGEGWIYHKREEPFRRGNLHSVSLLPTDQIVLGRVLAEREGCYLHAGGAAFHGKGLLFVGHAGAGKSTVVAMLRDKAEIFSDDRTIVRRWNGGFRIHGTWSHGDFKEVSPKSAPLAGILFLRQAQKNQLLSLNTGQEIIRELLACLIKPLLTADWWNKMLVLMGDLAQRVPCYSLRFDKSGGIADLLESFVLERERGLGGGDGGKGA
jgi:hypothetical protein